MCSIPRGHTLGHDVEWWEQGTRAGRRDVPALAGMAACSRTVYAAHTTQAHLSIDALERAARLSEVLGLEPVLHLVLGPQVGRALRFSCGRRCVALLCMQASAGDMRRGGPGAPGGGWLDEVEGQGIEGACLGRGGLVTCPLGRSHPKLPPSLLGGAIWQAQKRNAARHCLSLGELAAAAAGAHPWAHPHPRATHRRHGGGGPKAEHSSSGSGVGRKARCWPPAWRVWGQGAGGRGRGRGLLLLPGMAQCREGVGTPSPAQRGPVGERVVRPYRVALGWVFCWVSGVGLGRVVSPAVEGGGWVRADGKG